MVEYATLTAALAILASSLGGTLGSVAALPATDVKAAALISKVAAQQHVPAPSARAAYAKAPFRRPALRYLYAVGFITAAKDRAACQAALLLGPKPKEAAVQFLRRSPRVLDRLRAAHVTVSQAATAIGRGTVDGCA